MKWTLGKAGRFKRLHTVIYETVSRFRTIGVERQMGEPGTLTVRVDVKWTVRS